MAQKATAARKPALKIAKGSSPKKAAAAAKPSVLEKVKKALGKVVAVPAAEAKVIAKAKAGKAAAAVKTSAGKTAPVKPATPVKTVAPANATVKAEPQIEKAKAALKKQSKATAEAQVAPAAKPVEAKPARARKISIDINSNESSGALSAKWTTLNKKADQIESKPYNMKGVFEEKTAIVHKVLGWGYIMANRNDRLEVLFKDGIKYLISNYKA